MAKPTSWDLYTPEKYGFDADQLERFVTSSEYCFMARLRRDGHPIGAYYGVFHKAGQSFVTTNVFRKAYEAVKRDPRITVVFAKHNVGEVTIIGRGEIVDDRPLTEQFFLEKAPTNFRVASGEWTVEQFMRTACSENRRLIRVVAERIVSSDLMKLPLNDED